MKIYRKCWQTLVTGHIDPVWDFFSNPGNLQHITPKYMNFKVLNDLDDSTMHPGMLIRYTVSPIANIPLNWVTEITAVKHHEYFIDEQRFGPYAFWHHKHHFKPQGDDVQMTDELHYALPLGIIGQMMHKIFIDQRIDHIFEYRESIIKELFK